MDNNSKPVDHPSQETVEVRQGTGPRATVSVLLISTALALTAGAHPAGIFPRTLWHLTGGGLVDFINRIMDRVIEFTGPYGAVVLLAVIVILVFYRLMGRA